jgi:hypothetical protein
VYYGDPTSEDPIAARGANDAGTDDGIFYSRRQPADDSRNFCRRTLRLNGASGTA